MVRDELDVNIYNKREIEARSKFTINREQNVEEMRIAYKDMYIKSTKDFTDVEKENVFGAIKSLFSRFKDQVPLIRAWNIIKLEDDIDWGFPHTLGNYIMIQQKHLGDMDSLAELLFHEQLHIIQRNNKGIFRDFYIKNWVELYHWSNKYLAINHCYNQ